MKRNGYYILHTLLAVLLGFSQAQAQILAVNSEDGAEDAVESRCQDPLGEPGVRSDALALDSRVHAASLTGVAQTEDVSSFVLAGAAEVGDQDAASMPERVVRYGESSPDAMKEKARRVMDIMEIRLAALGVDWPAVTNTQLYTVYDIHSFMADEIVGRGGAPAGITWYYARPPVEGLDFEVDLRGIPVQRVI